MANEPPHLETQRLVLGPFRLEDISDVYSYAGNPNVAKLTSWEAHRSAEDSRAFVEWAIRRSSANPAWLAYTWAIRGKGGGRVMGSIDFTQTSPTEGQVDYALAEPHWGKGFTPEASHAVIDFAFRTVQTLRRIISKALTENQASIRVMQKVGMSFVEERRERLPKFGAEMKRMSTYAIDRETWCKRQGAI